MSSAKGVHNKNITELGIGFGESVIVLFLAGIKAHIFEDNDIAIVHFNATGPALFESNGLAEQAAEMFGNGLHTEVGVVLAFSGSTQVGHQNHFRAGCNSLLDSGQCRFNTGITGDLAVLNRNVEVFTDQHALAG